MQLYGAALSRDPRTARSRLMRPIPTLHRVALAPQAWMLGIDEKELTSGPKPDDLELVECHEDWSHTGTPQWNPEPNSNPSPNPNPHQARRSGRAARMALARTRRLRRHSMLKVASLAAAHAATHRSRSLPAGPGPSSGPKTRALAAWMPKWGCGDVLAPRPTSPIPASFEPPRRQRRASSSRCACSLTRSGRRRHRRPPTRKRPEPWIGIGARQA